MVRPPDLDRRTLVHYCGLYTPDEPADEGDEMSETHRIEKAGRTWAVMRRFKSGWIVDQLFGTKREAMAYVERWEAANA